VGALQLLRARCDIKPIAFKLFVGDGVARELFKARVSRILTIDDITDAYRWTEAGRQVE
jgi:hypothetical protein